MLDAQHATDAVLGVGADSTLSRTQLFMRQGITDILERADDSQAVGRILTLLEETFECTDLDQLRSEFGEPLTSQNIISFAYFAVSAIDDERAGKILASHADKFSFQYSPNADMKLQLQAFLDSRINSMLVEYAIQGLGKAIWDGTITEKVCLDIAGELSANNTAKLVNPIFFDAVEKALRKLQHEHPGEPIYHLSIGCGRGINDRNLYNEIRRRMPELDFRVVGFDPAEAVANNPIVTEMGGTLINRELAPGETYIQALKKELNVESPVVLATERYALHHMNRSVDKLLGDLEGAPLISVDHPISPSQRESLSERTAMIAYDLLSNHVRTVKSSGTWIPNAMANPEIFSILYRREEDMAAQKEAGLEYMSVEGKKPPTWIITYPEGIELSRNVKFSTRAKSHIFAAQNPPGGKWVASPDNP